MKQTKFKDFEQFYHDQLHPQPKFRNPYSYMTQSLSITIQKMIFKNAFIQSQIMLFASILTAPLQTIVSSLQMSVMPHKNIFQKTLQSQPQVDPKSKQLKKINKQLTLRQKRNLQLQLYSGRKNPYTAQVYGSYTEAFRALMNQGWKAFFKGNLFRSIHIFVHNMNFFFFPYFLATQQTLTSALLKWYFFKTFTDICLNALQVAENHYTLQSKLEKLQFYSSFKFFRRKLNTRNEIFKGWKFHLLNNAFDCFRLFPILQVIYSSDSIAKVCLIYCSIQFLAYPFSTVYKRFICQSTGTGLIPIRYSSLSHGLKVIFFEEGIKGLWRGWNLYTLVLVGRIGCLSYTPQLTQYFNNQ